MKINDTHGAGVSGVGQSQDLTNTGFSSKTKGAGASQQDRVSLSSLGSALGAQQSNSAEHSARLNQLSANVAAGAYHVNANALSTQIIESSTKA